MSDGKIVDIKVADRIAVANKFYYAEQLCKEYEGYNMWVDPETQKIVKSDKP